MLQLCSYKNKNKTVACAVFLCLLLHITIWNCNYDKYNNYKG